MAASRIADYRALGPLAAGGLLLAAVFLAGCSGSDLPKTVPASGIVMLDGQPVDGALVTFSSVQSGGRPASGTTDASGRFTLTTYLAPDAIGKGAIPGDYKVTVVKTEMPSGPAPAEASRDAYTPPPNLLPVRYVNPQNSPLAASVTETGPNDFTFDLTR